MTLQALRCFAAVGKTLSFAEASKQLYISQPAVTHQIKQLENELGVRLFDRTQHSVRLTPAGELFYGEVPELLRRLDLAVEQVRREPCFTETLTVGCESTIRMELLPQIYREFQLACPTVRINTVEITSYNERELEKTGRLDVMFTSKYSVRCPPEIRYRALYRGQFCCVLPKEHPLAGREELSPRDLNGQTLIFLDSSVCPPFMDQIQNALRTACRDIHIYLSSSSIYTGAMIRGGLGIAVMPSFVFPREEQLCAVPFDMGVGVEYGIAHHSYDTSDKVRKFVRIARRLYAERGADTFLAESNGVR